MSLAINMLWAVFLEPTVTKVKTENSDMNATAKIF